MLVRGSVVTIRKQGYLRLNAQRQSGKMKSDSDFNVDADAPSLSVGKNSDGKNLAKRTVFFPSMTELLFR